MTCRLSQHKVRRLIEALAEDWCDCLTELEEIPRCGGVKPELGTVYILSNADREVLYVGQTKNLQKRLRQHECKPRIHLLDWDRVFYFHPGIGHVHRRLIVETVLIATCCPPGNLAILLKLTKSRTWTPIRFPRTRREQFRAAMRMED